MAALNPHPSNTQINVSSSINLLQQIKSQTKRVRKKNTQTQKEGEKAATDVINFKSNSIANLL